MSFTNNKDNIVYWGNYHMDFKQSCICLTHFTQGLSICQKERHNRLSPWLCSNILSSL